MRPLPDRRNHFRRRGDGGRPNGRGVHGRPGRRDPSVGHRPRTGPELFPPRRPGGRAVAPDRGVEAPRSDERTSSTARGDRRYASGLQAELEQSGACNALHRADQRFAKWLLRCHDRIDGNTLHLTQEYLGSMLGAQRTTVNEAAQTLQKAGAITYSRGRITIVDRAALERLACECYNAHTREPALVR
ncbi:MAG: helix-turn-helix domain-containing protein [Caulobacteraceae bacterium]|nr:helix-turn-helix domain-containing protein [Caulobacteraceae bacterium]